MEHEIWKVLLGSGIGTALMAMALKWLDSDRSKILAALGEERARRIEVLEKSSAECANDRLQLHTNLSELQKEVRALYETLIERKNHIADLEKSVLELRILLEGKK